MIVTIVGAGGVGGYIGSRLAEAGYDVCFLVRGQTLNALRNRGLFVEAPAGDIRLAKPFASPSALDLGVADAVIVAVKIYDLESVAPDLKPLIGPQTAILPLQNGVEAHSILTKATGHAAVLKGVVSIKSYIAEPGIVVCKSQFCRITLGPPSPAMSESAQARKRCARCCRAAKASRRKFRPISTAISGSNS